MPKGSSSIATYNNKEECEDTLRLFNSTPQNQAVLEILCKETTTTTVTTTTAAPEKTWKFACSSCGCVFVGEFNGDYNSQEECENVWGSKTTQEKSCYCIDQEISFGCGSDCLLVSPIPRRQSGLTLPLIPGSPEYDAKRGSSTNHGKRA